MERKVYTLLVFLGFIAFLPHIYAEEIFDIYIPDKMIVGEKYQGQITLQFGASEDREISISSDNNKVKIPSTVIVQANQNHGIFDITPISEGTVKVTSLYDGNVVYVDSYIFIKKSSPITLNIVFPSLSTIANDLTGFVFVMDGSGAPVKSDKDIMVSLVATDKIFAPSNIVIKNGTTNTSFEMMIHGDGKVTASALGLFSASESILKTYDNVDVKIGTPDLILENSRFNYVVWFEKDGLPYTIQRPVTGKIQSSDNDVVRLNVIPPGNQNYEIKSISISDGLYAGELYTGKSGFAEIFISIPDFGSVSTTVFVGPAVIHEDEIIEYGVDGKYDYEEPNYIQFRVFPPITDDVAYGLASLYHVKLSDELVISMNNDGEQITDEITYTTLFPIESNYNRISISAQNGLEYDSDYLVGSPNLRTNNKIFEINAESTGSYTITVIGGGNSDTATLDVVSPNHSNYSILATPLPVLSQNFQPLFMVSIVDENNNIVDINNMFGNFIEIDIYNFDSDIVSNKLTLHGNVGIVSGRVDTIDSFTFSSNTLGISMEESISPSGVSSSVEISTPSKIHQGESFVITVHDVDAYGVPISKQKTESLISSGFEKIENGLVRILEEGTVSLSVLSQLGGGIQRDIFSFSNKMDFDVIHDDQDIRVGKSFTVNLKSDNQGITYTINSPFPYTHPDENVFEITPSAEVTNAVIIITGELNGFKTTEKRIIVSSIDLVEIKTSAITTNGKILSPEYKYYLINSEGIDNTPSTHIGKSQQAIFDFPTNISTLTGGYKLVEMKLNGDVTPGNRLDFFANSDSEIIAIYDRVVNIVIHDGQGGGAYSLGDKVSISAPDKQKISFLIVEKFVRWDGIDKSSSFEITAKDDLEITAIYDDNYFGLMALIIGITIPFAIILFRVKDGKIQYYTRVVKDLLKSTIKIPTKK